MHGDSHTEASVPWSLLQRRATPNDSPLAAYDEVEGLEILCDHGDENGR